MDSAEQANGEKRVKQVLIDPLMKRGLGRPTTLTKKGFEDMVADLCARLAYMSEDSLMALEEQAAANPSGPSRDRFPIANNILTWAGHIHPPGDSASPLLRAVFASQLGRDAIDQGWAPELLADVKRTRMWPNRFVVSQIKDRADNALRDMRHFEEALAKGEYLSQDKQTWRQRRLEALQKCRDIAALAPATGGAAC